MRKAALAAVAAVFVFAGPAFARMPFEAVGPKKHAHRPHMRVRANGRVRIYGHVPRKVRQIVHAGNKIATTPYVWGGGHGAWEAFGYDCSGSVSYALHRAGLLGIPETSGSLTAYGRPGPGRWVTIYADSGHVWMTVGKLRFDTIARKATGSRWSAAPGNAGGMAVRHPAGL